MKPYLEDKEIYPDNMIGFGQGLATQDAMKLVKTQLLYSTTRGVEAILGLEIDKAFHNIRPSFILQQISTLYLGQLLHDYIRDFLRGRQASLRVGSLQSEAFVLGDRGTPQGSVTSATLFNLTIIGLSRQLTRIENLQHSTYADDVTMLVAKGSKGQIEHTLQNAVRTTEEHLKPTGLRGLTKKSEPLL
ncbi:uncharacterized protein LOC142591433 [Dermacentor variabilis]|uniref:uncharacterized protein LOC142591433 n=1 Tax=Dermacentor variabilis TaxID=34621 RepID=UPI003F5BEB9D